MLLRILSQKPAPTIGVIVASGREVRFYTPQIITQDRPTSWTRQHPLVSEDTHIAFEPLPDRTIFRDDSLIDVESLAAEHTTTPHAKLKDHTKDDMTHALSTELNKAIVNGHFSHLILVAPTRLLAGIKEQLTPRTRAHILAEIHKELDRDGHINPQELLAHIEAALEEARA